MSEYKLDSQGRPIVKWEDLDLSSVKDPNRDTAILCPNCSHTRKKKGVKCMQVLVSKGVANCKHCSAISVKPKDSETSGSHTPYVKEYKLPDTSNFTQLSDNAKKWFKDVRKISENTLIQYDISSSTQYMGQVGANRNTIAFPYKIKGETVSVKYRDAEKNFKISKDAKQVLYGLDHINNSDTVVYVEGEIDTLTMYECGFSSVSTPTGAPSVTESDKEIYEATGKWDENRVINLEYLDNSMDYISSVKKWIIAVDMDMPGRRLRDELIRRFGAENCKVVDWSPYKDANEALVDKGIMYVQEKIENAVDVPLERVVTANDVSDYLEDVRMNGYQKGLSLGMKMFDDHFRQRLGELDVYVGPANMGKSYTTFWLNLIMSALHGWKWAVYVPENSPPGEFYRLIIQMLTGKTFKKGYDNSLTRGELEVAREWVNKHFFVVDFSDEDKAVTYDMLLDKFRELVFRKGINGCLIDPINDLDMTRKPGMNIDEYYQKMLGKMRKFKQRYNLKMQILVHPVSEADRMTENHDVQGNRPKVVELAEISGGSIWKNRVDNGISIYRNFWLKEVSNTTEIHVKKVKWQESVGVPTPKKFPIEVQYDVTINRFRCNGYDPLEGFWEREVWGPVVSPQQSEIKLTTSHSSAIDAFESEEPPF